MIPPENIIQKNKELGQKSASHWIRTLLRGLIRIIDPQLIVLPLACENLNK